MGSHWCPAGYGGEDITLLVHGPAPHLTGCLETGKNNASEPMWSPCFYVWVRVAFTGSQDYRVWVWALYVDPISTFFLSATPKSLIVWPQTKYFETTPLQLVLNSGPGCLNWASTRRLATISSVVCSSVFKSSEEIIVEVVLARKIEEIKMSVLWALFVYLRSRVESKYIQCHAYISFLFWIEKLIGLSLGIFSLIAT